MNLAIETPDVCHLAVLERCEIWFGISFVAVFMGVGAVAVRMVSAQEKFERVRT